MSDTLAPRIDTLEIRLTEQEATIEDLNRTITEQWRLIDRLRRQVAALQDQFEEAGTRSPTGTESPPPHY
ncbi:SlyX family protein [Methylobacterium iners]|uniref:Protein SlyX homolog n=1 Tax=Methylobacterium iners TaxID=418707 RepID=A0ABQ4S146_9HYPH|nr:SlyX family protein [Methylobacterium iners]GJD95897.1 Protein SlyX [Methylobacterium iners]